MAEQVAPKKKGILFTRPKTFAAQMGGRRPGVCYAISPTLKKKIRATQDPLEKSMLANSGWRSEQSLANTMEGIKQRHTAYLQEMEERHQKQHAEKTLKRMERSASMRQPSMGGDMGVAEQEVSMSQPQIQEVPKPISHQQQIPQPQLPQMSQSQVQQSPKPRVVPPMLQIPHVTHTPQMQLIPQVPKPHMHQAPQVMEIPQMQRQYSSHAVRQLFPVQQQNSPSPPVFDFSPHIQQPVQNMQELPYRGVESQHDIIIPDMEIVDFEMPEPVTTLGGPSMGEQFYPESIPRFMEPHQQVNLAAHAQSSASGTHVANAIEGLFTSLAGNVPKGDMEQFSQIISSLADAYHRLDVFMKSLK